MNNIYTEIEMDYATLEEGASLSGQLCPKCKGGGSGEKSFSITRTSGCLLFTCHRSGCGFSGQAGAATPPGKRQPFTMKRPLPAIVPIGAPLWNYLEERYHLLPTQRAELGYVESGYYGERVAHHISSRERRCVGYNFRTYGALKPKALIVKISEDFRGLAWYNTLRTSPSLVIVEDQMSAIRLEPHVHAVALLGTNLNEIKIEEIAESPRYRDIYLCLDNDATSEAIRLKFRWQERLPQLRVIGLEDDVKDQSPKDFDAFLEKVLC